MELPDLWQPTWVEVVIEAGHVHSMTVTPFDVTALDRVHFVASPPVAAGQPPLLRAGSL